MANNKLTDNNKEFIRKNYLTMSSAQMADAIGSVTKYAVVGFKLKEGLRKLHYSRQPKHKKVIKMRSRFFNVHALENWVA